MQVIGILGGIASGKSFVSEELRRLGAAVLDADKCGHEVLRIATVREAVVQHFGRQILAEDGEIDRRQLAGIVFARTAAGARQLAVLEKLTHPEIGRRLLAEMEELRRGGAVAAVLDAPVLLKAGWDAFCDRIIYVDAPEELRLQRALSRGWSREDFAAREAAQESLQRKRRKADLVIDNSGSLESTRSQVEQFWCSLRSSQNSRPV